jgi:hypothetical protein
MRTTILGFLAAMLMAFALPASAANPEKIYSLNVSPLGTSPIALTIKNETPNGNSTVNSFVISPPQGVTIDSLSNPKYLAQSGTANVQLIGGKVYVNSFTGLQAANKTPKALTIYVNATYPTSTACGAQYTWTADVYTGNAFGQETFALVTGVPPTSPTQTAICEYKVVMSPASLAAGISTAAGSHLTATITNKTAAGGPNITTATLTAPTGVTPKATGLASTSGTAALAGVLVTVSGASVAPGGSMAVTIPVETACAASTGNWTPTASGTSGSFALSTSDASSLGTAVTGACSMAFTQQPTNVVAGVAISPPVISVVNGATGSPVPWFNGSVWLTTGACTATPIATATASGGVATFPVVILNTIGLTTLTACSTFGSTNFSVASNSFTVYSGTLDCYPNTYTGGDLDPGALKSYVKASDQGKWGLVRGNNKPDSAPCQAVPYIFNLNVTSSPQLASFIVPDPAVNLQKVAAEYVVVWGRVAVDASGDVSKWTTKRPKLSWGTASAPITGSNDYAPALSCVLDPDNPDLTGTGNTYPNGFRSVPTTDLDKLLPVIPNVEPFITLGTTHPQYAPGQKAMMCIAQQGWTAVGQDDPLGPTLIQYWTRVIDQADGFMSLDN